MRAVETSALSAALCRDPLISALIYRRHDLFQLRLAEAVMRITCRHLGMSVGKGSDQARSSRLGTEDLDGFQWMANYYVYGC